MKKNRILSLLLCAMLLSTCGLSACGQSEQVSETTTDTPDTTEVTEAAETETPLPDANFEGSTFSFLNGNVSYTYGSIIAEEQTGDTMNDTIYQRNTAVEDLYNITLAETMTNNAQSDYTKSVTAGSGDFDIALLRMEWAFPVVIDNSAISWDNIPHLQLDREWWVQDSIRSMSLLNKVYFAVSAFDTSHFESIRAFVYNKDMAEDYQLTSPYELVKSGEWTLDTFHDMAMTVAQDTDNDGKWTIADQYGVTSSSNVLNNTLMCGIGSILSIGKDDTDIPYFDLDNELHINDLLRVAKFYEAQNGFAERNNKQELFKAGQALFRCCLLSEVAALRDMEDDFGILPAPKSDAEQAEYYNLGGSPFFMTVPVTAIDLDCTGILMEALARGSMGLIDAAYYDTILKGKVSRDEESVEMLDLICSTLRYYHPLANSYLNSPLADNYIWNGKTDFASYFASVKEKINSEIEAAMTTFAGNGN